MIVIPGQKGKDLCDRHLGVTRRDLLRVGGSGMLGLSLASMFQLQAKAEGSPHVVKAPKGKAKKLRGTLFQPTVSIVMSPYTSHPGGAVGGALTNSISSSVSWRIKVATMLSVSPTVMS